MGIDVARSVVAVGGEVFQALLYGGGDVSGQGYFGGYGLHLRRVIAQESFVDGGAVFGVHHHEVYLEVGDDEG